MFDFTDAGLAAGIGGCTELNLDRTFAKYVPMYAYEFDARRGPGLVPIPGYVWGAGHAAELAYLCVGAAAAVSILFVIVTRLVSSVGPTDDGQLQVLLAAALVAIGTLVGLYAALRPERVA